MSRTSGRHRLEVELDRLERQQVTAGGWAGDQDDADMEREKAYRVAEQINMQLDQMAGSMKDVVNGLNQTHLTQTDDQSATNVVLKILNKHHRSLEWLDQRTRQLNDEVTSTAKRLRNKQAQTQASVSAYRPAGRGY